jgi:flagellin
MPTLNLNQHSLSLASGLGRLQPKITAVTARISSGERIDTPAADIAGTGMAAKLDAQQARIRGVQVNLQNGVSRMQVTSGQLDVISRVVTRMGEISTLASNPVQDPVSRALYASEFTQLQDQLRATVGGTTAEIGGTADVPPSGVFNGKPLFGSAAAETLGIGLQTDEVLTLPVLDFQNGALGALLRKDGAGGFTAKLGDAGLGDTIKAALGQATAAYADVGAVQSRLEFSAGVVSTANANHEAALSVIRDADIAADSTARARLQILGESHTAMLAQARDASAKLIDLLKG